MEHLKICKAQSAMCNYCGRKGHLERVCNQKKNDNFMKSGAKTRQTGKFKSSGRRVQLVDQEKEDGDGKTTLS